MFACACANHGREAAKSIAGNVSRSPALDAATFHARTFPDSAVFPVHRAPRGYPGWTQSDVWTVEFTVMGTACLSLSGEPANAALVFGLGLN